MNFEGEIFTIQTEVYGGLRSSEAVEQGKKAYTIKIYSQ